MNSIKKLVLQFGQPAMEENNPVNVNLVWPSANANVANESTCDSRALI
jgi:hypothetical protein